MIIGSKITAPQGWTSIPIGIEVHFLKSDYKNNRVLLVHFQKNCNDQYHANLITIVKTDFEDGVSQNKIIPCLNQSTLPPWLEKLEQIDLSMIDIYRSSNAQISHHDRVNQRYLIILAAVNDFEVIMSSNDPQSSINEKARLCTPPQNESRFRLWLLTYLCFGRNIWSLLPPFHNSGQWDRLLYPDKKFGAPSKAFGRNYGYGKSKELVKKCIKSYLKRAKLGKFMTTIYQEAMAYDFKCKVISLPGRMSVFASTDGSAFPTYDQFRYQIYKDIGRETVQKKIYGEVRHRTRIAASKGRFSEEIGNLMERIEADGYYISDRPVGYIEGSTLPAICVVIGRDTLSGAKLGIGFSFGAERSSAYRMMLFSMAVPKVYFCNLFGLEIDASEWMNLGLPPHFGIDRGPGARINLIEELEKKFPIRDLAPSWSGQSKATVESSHPKDVKIEGQPTFTDSTLNPTQLTKREIMRLISFNKTANMEDRIDPDSAMANVIPSPNGIWDYYDHQYRNDSHPISIEEAIRTFLTPMEFVVKEDGVYLNSRRFYCENLRDTGIFDLGGVTRIQGYILDMCVRYVWIEVKHKLIEVPAMLRIRGDEDSLFMSIAELEQWSEQRKNILSGYRIHQQSSNADIMQRFRDSTGKEFTAGIRVKGTPKKNAISKNEANEILHSASRKSTYYKSK